MRKQGLKKYPKFIEKMKKKILIASFASLMLCTLSVTNSPVKAAATGGGSGNAGGGAGGGGNARFTGSWWYNDQNDTHGCDCWMPNSDCCK